MKKRLFAGVAAALCCAGLAMAQPANDLCTNAIPVSIPSMTPGTTVGATVESPAPPTCVTSYTAPGVWYTLVGNGNTLTLDLCTSNFDTKLHVYCNSPGSPCGGTFACVTGNDDTTGCGVNGSRVSFCSASGQTYHVLVSGFLSVTGTFTLNVVDGAACTTPVGCVVGACCSTSGACTIVAQSACTGTSLFQGTGTACAPTNPCTALLGACCNNTTGACTTVISGGCSTTTSTFLGAGTVCNPSPCPNVGACCTSSGSCSIVAQGSCTAATSTWLGGQTSCTPTNPCTPLLRACCSSTGTCSLTIPQGCAGATQTFLSTATTCTPVNPCTAILGACCNTTTSACTTTTTNGCPAATSTFLGVGTVCGVNLCPNTGACCAPSGTCSVTTATGCAATSFFQGVGVTCGPTNPCLALSGACCANTGVCTVRPVSDCTAPSLFAGIATTCGAGDVCPITVRACCNNTTGVCTFQTATCPTGSTEVGTVCAPTPCPSTPPIAAAADFGDPVGERGTVLLSVTITTPGNNPPSASYTVTTDASTLGGPMSLALLDNGLGVDLAAGDNVFTAAVNVTSASGAYPLTFTVMDDQMRTPTAAVTTTVNVAAINGACCAASGSCTLSAGNACIAGGGTFQGVGTVCSGPFYNLSSSMSAFTSISATGTLLSNTNSDDAVATIPIGFTFNYLGTDFTDVSVSSNGNLQFGAAPSTSFTNVAIPAAATPNNMLAPLWDDFNALTAGDIYSRLDGAAPNRTLTISWEGVPQFGAPAGDSSSFQVVLFEGSNNFEFRYGAISTAVIAVNDFATVGFENAAGTAGRGIDRSTLGAGNTAIAGTRVDGNPCPQPLTGACCTGSTCVITDAPSCAGANQSFRGNGTACNLAGDNTTPCCFADYNQSGSVTVQDIFDFLAAYFGQSASADINGSGTVTVQDIFDFLAAYFTGCN